jgi:hypothetical protein
MVIQKPAPHDRFIKSGRFDHSFHQPFDEGYIKDKFANVPGRLSRRLGKAISRRRQFLEYRKNHHARIAGPEASMDPEDTGTVVSSLPTAAKQGQCLGASEIVEPTISRRPEDRRLPTPKRLLAKTHCSFRRCRSPPKAGQCLNARIAL